MMERISSGEQMIGTNVFLSYAHTRPRKDPSIAYEVPKDYALVLSSVAFVSKTARNPNAAKLFLDYLLSKRGQTTLATASEPPWPRHLPNVGWRGWMQSLKSAAPFQSGSGASCPARGV